MWMSNEIIPQEIIFNVLNMKQKPLIIRGFGIYCSQSTSYNPKIIEVLCQHKNKQNYISLGNFKLSLSVGTQILTTEEVIFNDIERIKFIIKETYGGKKTYINKIYLYEYLPRSDFNMSYQFEDLNINEESEINKNILKNSNKMKIGDLNINDITNITNISKINNNNKKEKIISNNLPTRTTDILITESDLTDKPKKKKKKYYSLEVTQNKCQKNKNKINTKNNDIKNSNNNINHTINNTNKDKQKDEQNNKKKKKEEEKHNVSNITDKEKVLDQNISIQSKKKDIYNNSKIIFTTTEVKNNTLDDNNNIINTISNISNNKINNCNDNYINIKNKMTEYDFRLSYIENDINNLKEVINEILNNLNQVNQNKNYYHKINSEIEYNTILAECKKYIDL